MTQTFAEIFAAAPLGAVIRFSDGTPQPPERFKRKLSDWKNRNDAGRLTERQASGGRGEWDRDSFSLHLGDYGSGGVTVLSVNRSFSDRSPGSFEVIGLPTQGAFAVIGHSQFTGDHWLGEFATIDEARAKASRNSYGNPTIHRIGEAGQLGETLWAIPALEDMPA